MPRILNWDTQQVSQHMFDVAMPYSI